MSIANVVTGGFGLGASVAFVSRDGFGASSAVIVTVVPDRSDGKPRRHGDDELTEGEVQWMQRKLHELKSAKTEKQKQAAAKALEVSLAQAAQDDEAAEVITGAIQEKRPEAILQADYGSVMRDVALLTDITNKLAVIAKEAAEYQQMMEDEDDVETLLMLL